MSIFSEPHLMNSARWSNRRVGLLGGSFNPPHKGHAHISEIVLKTLHLDAVWWLVTPQNPLKDSSELLSMDERAQMCCDLIDNPRIVVTTLERDMGSVYSYQTVMSLKKHFPNTNFAWITGMDNAHNLHRWQKWQSILSEMCMVHITRHPPVKLIKNCPTRMLASQKHIMLERGGKLPLDSNTTYWLLQKKMVNISSTEIRSRSKSYKAKSV